jgi:hypothetical protein
VRRVAATYLLYLGELSKLKAKFDADTTNIKNSVAKGQSKRGKKSLEFEGAEV